MSFDLCTSRSRLHTPSKCIALRLFIWLRTFKQLYCWRYFVPHGTKELRESEFAWEHVSQRPINQWTIVMNKDIHFTWDMLSDTLAWRCSIVYRNFLICNVTVSAEVTIAWLLFVCQGSDFFVVFTGLFTGQVVSVMFSYSFSCDSP